MAGRLPAGLPLRHPSAPAKTVFTTVAILSLAIGIGATTAIFGLIDRVLLRTLPVREPTRLVEVGPYESLSYPLFQELASRLDTFEGMFAHTRLGTLDIVLDGRTETAEIDMASGAYYSVLGVPATIGRTFTEDVDRAPGGTPVAVISYDYWKRQFAFDPAVIGKTLERLGTVFTIIGVTPRGFFGPSVGRTFDITVPLSMDAQMAGR